MIYVHITTTLIDQQNDAGPMSVAVAVIPCHTRMDADRIVQDVHNQRNGGNNAPNGLRHDTMVIGN
jgi:hypothetical protein